MADNVAGAFVVPLAVVHVLWLVGGLAGTCTDVAVEVLAVVAAMTESTIDAAPGVLTVTVTVAET